jgi:HEAT repeat protein
MLPTVTPAAGPRREDSSPARRILLIAQNLRELSSREIETKTEAARRLNEQAPTAGELTVLMSDRNPFVRSGAAWWLRNYAGDVPSDAVSALRSAIYDPNAHVVQAALGTAGVLRLEAARDDVLACLEDASAGVIHGAIFALGRMGPPELGARVVPFLQHAESHLELAAVQALTNLRYRPAVPALLARLKACCGVVRRARSHFELPRRLIAALVGLEAREAVPLLIEIARDEIGLRGMAVQALIDLRAEEAGPALLPLLARLAQSNTEEKLCNSLLYLMTAIDYRFAAPAVRAFLEHKLAPVRCAALKAVCRWRDREASAQVRQMARHDVSAFVRPVAVTALADLLGSEAVADLDELAGDANTLVRAAVAEAIQRLEPMPEAAQPILTRLASDPAANVGRTAREALERSPQPVVMSGEMVSPLPADLREQAAAARAFLARWKSELTTAPPEERQRVEQALATLLGVLREA